MDLTHERFGFGQESTLAEMLVDGLHECFLLEDERRKTKVKGETCIPVGTYKVELRTEGGMHKRYSTRFPNFHRGMIWIRHVPGFEYVYYHIGNDEGDTDGCPLNGRYPVVLPSGEFKVAESTAAYLAFAKKVYAAMDRGEEVWVTVRERNPLP